MRVSFVSAHYACARRQIQALRQAGITKNLAGSQAGENAAKVFAHVRLTPSAQNSITHRA
jgi:hypothetical protein